MKDKELKTVQYLREDEVFQLAREAAEGMTREEVADQLDCDTSQVIRMLRENPDPRVISLAVEFVEMRFPSASWQIQKYLSKKPVKYYRVQSAEDEVQII